MKKTKLETLKANNRKKNREKQFYRFCMEQAKLTGRKIRIFEKVPLADLIHSVAVFYNRTDTEAETALKRRFEKIELKIAWWTSAELDDFETL